LPNTQQILARFKPALERTSWDTAGVNRFLLWSPSVRWALVLSVVFLGALVGLKDPSTFLYFQF
jgi:hypothetical protein